MPWSFVTKMWEHLKKLAIEMLTHGKFQVEQMAMCDLLRLASLQGILVSTIGFIINLQLQMPHAIVTYNHTKKMMCMAPSKNVDYVINTNFSSN